MKDIAPNLARLIAFLIDLLLSIGWVVLFVLFIASASTVIDLLQTLLSMTILLPIAGIVIFTLLTSWLTSTFGGSIGKLLTGLEVVDVQGNHISFWRAVFRNYLGYIISGLFLWLGFAWVLRDKDHRAWHDLISDTYVKSTNKNRQFLGMVSLVVLLVGNIYLVRSVLANFAMHAPLYTSIFTEVKTAVQDALKSKEVAK